MNSKVVGAHKQRKYRKVVGYRPASGADHLGPLVTAACNVFLAKRGMKFDPVDFAFGRRK